MARLEEDEWMLNSNNHKKRFNNNSLAIKKRGEAAKTQELGYIST